MKNLDIIKENKIYHKKEVDKIKNKYIQEIEIFKEKRNTEENERAEQRQHEIKDLYNKIEKLKQDKEIMNCEKCNNIQQQSITVKDHKETSQEPVTYNCKGFSFKTNCMANMKEHRKRCNNTKQRKKL